MPIVLHNRALMHKHYQEHDIDCECAECKNPGYERVIADCRSSYDGSPEQWIADNGSAYDEALVVQPSGDDMFYPIRYLGWYRKNPNNGIWHQVEPRYTVYTEGPRLRCYYEEWLAGTHDTNSLHTPEMFLKLIEMKLDCVNKGIPPLYYIDGVAVTLSEMHELLLAQKGG